MVVLAVVSLATPAAAETRSEPEQPNMVGVAVGSLFIGGALAIGGGLLAGTAVDKLGPCDVEAEKHHDAFEGPCARRTMYGAYAGAALGFGLGLYTVGRITGTDSSFLAIAGGAVAGAAVGAAIAKLVIHEGEYGDPANAELGVSALIVGPIAGAAFGFMRTKRVRVSSQPGLIRLDGGRVSLGLPAVSQRATRDGSSTMLSLAAGTF